MTEQALRELLQAVQSGRQSIDQALSRLRKLPFEDLGFAKIDHHRAIRCGNPEVIYCEGKTADQVAEIFQRRVDGGGNVLATRAAADVYEFVSRRLPAAEYNRIARTITLRQCEKVSHPGVIAILSAGTSDMPVAEEARVTAEIMDQDTQVFYDVGVAGLHRLLAHLPQIQQASVAIVAAGMEGALASVVGGLIDCPVIAVPTSVGYGASFNGLAALLAMLNSCASGVTVVNIDNGFGAGFAAALINRKLRRDKG